MCLSQLLILNFLSRLIRIFERERQRGGGERWRGTLGNWWQRSREIEIITLRASREKWIYRVDPDRIFQNPPTARANCLAFYFFPRRTSASLRSSSVDPRLDWTDFWEIPATGHYKVSRWEMLAVVRDVIVLRFRIPVKNLCNTDKLIRESYRIFSSVQVCTLRACK